MGIFRKQKARKALSLLETRIGGALPSELIQILEGHEGLQVGPCRFMEAESVAALSGRVPGWPAEFIPFATGGPDSYCLRKTPDISPSGWPVFLAMAQPPNVVPIASSFRGFLFFLALQFEPSASDGKEVERMKQFLGGMGMPGHIFEHKVPPTQLGEEFAKLDKGALVPPTIEALRRASTDLPTAGKGLLAIAKANPWWGAPYYLLARHYRQIGHIPNACGCYWNAIERAACYSGATTRAGFGDLGISQNCEADAVAFLRENEASLPAQVQQHFRWQWLRETHDLHDVKARFRIARHWVALEQWERALWALLDVIHEKWRDPAVANEVMVEMGAIYRRLGRAFEASVCEGGVSEHI